MYSFEWNGLHFKAIFRRLAGFERPEICPVDRFQRERAGRPRSQVKGNQRRDAVQDAVTATEFPAKCIFPNSETHSRHEMDGHAWTGDKRVPRRDAPTAQSAADK